jgi:hypothetical protein
MLPYGSYVERFKVNKKVQRFKVTHAAKKSEEILRNLTKTFKVIIRKPSKFMLVHAHHCCPHVDTCQFISFISLELVSATVEVRTQQRGDSQPEH